MTIQISEIEQIWKGCCPCDWDSRVESSRSKDSKYSRFNYGVHVRQELAAAFFRSF